MGLFSKLFGKKEEVKEKIEKIKPPSSPDLPEHNFPSYEPTPLSSSEGIKKQYKLL